jgi:hypothetical protein
MVTDADTDPTADTDADADAGEAEEGDAGELPQELDLSSYDPHRELMKSCTRCASLHWQRPLLCHKTTP